MRQLMADDGLGVAVDSVLQCAQHYDYDAYCEAFSWELDDPGSAVTRPRIDHL